MINELELLGHNAWFAEERLRLGGWILRADHGVTRRANSVLPLDNQHLSLDKAIDYVIDFYDSRKLIPRFQVTKASYPSNLDDVLAQRGFTMGLQVEIWTSPISSFIKQQSDYVTETSDSLSDDWIATYNKSSGYDSSTFAPRREIMERTILPKTYVMAMIGNEVIAVGYGVVEGDWLGIFSIATLPDRRHLGAATAVNKQLGIWGQSNGAKNAYLQVEKNNAPAKALYKKLGFIYGYDYWYRDFDTKEENAAGC